MTIWVDAKNPALFGSGISHWLLGLLEEIEPKLRNEITLAVPNISNTKIYPDLSIRRSSIWWPKFLPRRIAQITYDNFLFQIAAKNYRPTVIFSPYFDVLMPKSIPSVITVHDLCYIEAAKSYPFLQRKYFTWQMKRNLKRADFVVTVSETSKKALVSIGKVQEERIYVIENSLGTVFSSYSPSETELSIFRNQHASSFPRVLYTGGFENRKNIPNLLSALKILKSQGEEVRLIVSGSQKDQWLALLHSDHELLSMISFTGFLSDKELKVAYLSSDAVVAPSLSEGYGRSCIEAIATGTPLACSDINVFHEVAGDHAIYFDPSSPRAVASGIREVLTHKRDAPRLLDGTRRINQILEFENMLRRLASL
jgi:glycosyltransferase involved in cell wall biosynthesis